MKPFRYSLWVLAAVFLVAGVSVTSAMASEKTRVLLDSDANNELDDQHAIAYLLFNGGVFDVAGITVNRTRNGGDVSQHRMEAERVVKLCGLYPRVRVYAGANGEFEEIRKTLSQPEFDGSDAVDFIIRQAQATREGRLVLLPVGKLTNIALALAKDPSIAGKLRIVWLGSNYPEPGEYNQVNDEPSLNFILNTEVPFEVVLVRYGKPSGTDAVRASLADILDRMPGQGPHVDPAVVGRHGVAFHCFGDYSVNLFQHIELHGDPPSRALFDMAAVAIVKNAAWAKPREIPAPILEGGTWVERPSNRRRIVLWEDFDRNAILEDFYVTMKDYQLVRDGQ